MANVTIPGLTPLAAPVVEVGALGPAFAGEAMFYTPNPVFSTVSDGGSLEFPSYATGALGGPVVGQVWPPLRF